MVWNVASNQLEQERHCLKNPKWGGMNRQDVNDVGAPALEVGSLPAAAP